MLFRCEKLEFGTKPTDWELAPEDVQVEIDGANNNANEAKIQAERAKLRADGYMAFRYVRDWIEEAL